MIGRLGRLAAGDARDRVRRPAYVVSLLAAVGLAYLAVPASTSRWVILDLGGYRGVYTSAYVGTATALASALWLTLGGFYLVRNTVARDASTRVGQLLAAAPLRTSEYLLGKFLSNVLVLASMAVVLAGTAVVLQLARGESRSVDPIALLAPFVVLALPLLVVTAAAAVLFETTPGLRGGTGNILWFFLAIVAAIAGQSAAAPLGGLGVHAVAVSLQTALQAEHLDLPGHEFSLGLTYSDAPLRTFPWPGLHVTGGFLLTRLALVLLATAVAALPALWFSRFDPARSRRPGRSAMAGPGAEVGTGLDGPHPSQEAPVARAEPARARELHAASARAGVGLGDVTRRRAAGGRLVAGELRILVQGASRWWWLVAAALTGVALLLPTRQAPAALLGTWVWPVLVWSRLGSQRVENDVEGLLAAYPGPRRRRLAEGAAGVILTVLVGLGPGVRMLLAADRPGLACWTAGAVFIPSAALLLGAVSRTHRVFQAVYLPLWYLVVNGIAAADFMGVVRVDGRPVGPSPWLIGGSAVGMLLGVTLIDKARTAGAWRSVPLRVLARS